MPNIVLAGLSTPVQKVLERTGALEGINYKALFTELGASMEIETLAAGLGMQVFELSDLKTPQGAQRLKELETDWFFNINSTIIYDPDVLDVPREGALNMHPGLLPQYAGLHTHQWAIRNGEQGFGVTLHWMERLVDRGPIAFQKKFPLTPKDTGLSLFIKCLNAGADLVVQALGLIVRGQPLPKTTQDLSKRRLYLLRDAKDGRIDWEQPAGRILDFIRAADYGPFQCPTYTPITRSGSLDLLIRKARPGPDLSEASGLVTEVNGDGLVVSVGGGQSVILTVVEVPGRGVFKGEQVEGELGRLRGLRLSSGLDAGKEQ